MYASLHGIPLSDIKSKINKIIDFSELHDFVDCPVRTYSSGMQLRLAFSIITQIDADILLIDEAFAVGDSFFVQKCLRFIKNFQKSGTTILVSHDHNSIIQLCDNCIWLDEGRISLSGKPKDVVDSYLSSILSDNSRNKNSSPNQNIEEFGNYEAKIVKYRLLVNGVQSTCAKTGDQLQINSTFEFYKTKKNIIYGFVFRNKLGIDIFSDQIFSSVKAEYHINIFYSASISFIVPFLKNGEYFISIAIAERCNENLHFLHWLHDCCKIEIFDNDGCTGIFKNDSVKGSIEVAN